MGIYEFMLKRSSANLLLGSALLAGALSWSYMTGRELRSLTPSMPSAPPILKQHYALKNSIVEMAPYRDLTPELNAAVVALEDRVQAIGESSQYRSALSQYDEAFVAYRDAQEQQRKALDSAIGGQLVCAIPSVFPLTFGISGSMMKFRKKRESAAAQTVTA